MGFMDKMQFWKKKDDFGLDASASPGKGNDPLFAGTDKPMYDAGMGNIGGGLYGQNPEGNLGTTYMGAGFTQKQGGAMEDEVSSQSFQSMGAPISRQQGQFQVRESRLQDSSQDYIYGLEKDLEVISAKLDSIKAMLESLNQRVANIERIAYAQQSSKDNYKW